MITVPTPSTREVVAKLKSKFQLRDDIAFNSSLWFSYGSNLDRAYFEKKMLKEHSSLTLVDPRKAILCDYERRLDNRSSGHGLGYEVHPKPGRRVIGVVHRVPLKQLVPFLKMEGVLDEDSNVSERLSYGIVERPVRSGGEEVRALVLEGNRRKAVELNEYVEVSLKGARAFKIDSRQFRRDLRWAKSLL